VKSRTLVRHLLGETIKQVTVSGHRLLEGIHHLRTDQVLGRNHVVQVELQRLLQNVPLRLAVAFGNRDELFVELGVDFGCELLGCPWQRKLRVDSILTRLGT
jgi:hypothetical protein